MTVFVLVVFYAKKGSFFLFTEMKMLENLSCSNRIKKLEGCKLSG